MELCTSLSQHISSLPRNKLLNPTPSLPSKSSHRLPLSSSSARRLHCRLLFSNSPLPKATTSEETSSAGPNRFFGEDRHGVATLQEPPSVDKKVYDEKLPPEEPKEDSAVDGESPIFEFLDKFNMKLDSEDVYPILLNGSGALVAFYLASAVVGAIDSIPMFPKLMEIVGLGYTLWFSSRYLLFKKNREELVTKFEELKQQVLGSDDDDE